MKDMVDQKLLKFLHKLNTNKLPAYFNSYKPYLKRINTTYNLRRNPLPVPAVKVLEKCTKNLIGHSRLAFNNHESNIDC